MAKSDKCFWAPDRLRLQAQISSPKCKKKHWSLAILRLFSRGVQNFQKGRKEIHIISLKTPKRYCFEKSRKTYYFKPSCFACGRPFIGLQAKALFSVLT